MPVIIVIPEWIMVTTIGMQIGREAAMMVIAVQSVINGRIPPPMSGNVIDVLKTIKVG